MRINVEKKAEKLYTDRIGDDCLCDAMSVALEYMDKLYWALDYVDYKFLYNFDQFIAFENTNNLDEKISSDDPYYFRVRPGSVYNKDIMDYNEKLLSKNLKKMIRFYVFDENEFSSEIKKINQNGLFPVMLAVNTKAFGDFYKEVGAIYPRTDCIHVINVLSCTPDGNKCFIFDRGFDCMGHWIPTEKLKKGAIDDFINEGSHKFAYYAFEKHKLKDLTISDVREKFIGHMLRALKGDIIVNGHSYTNNTAALLQFRDDLFNIIEYLNDRYGKYAIPLFGEAIVMQADGSRGATRLYTEMSRYDNFKEIKENSKLLAAYTLSWQKFEKRLKYVVYGKREYGNIAQSLEKIVDELMRLDGEIINNINLILLKYDELYSNFFSEDLCHKSSFTIH